MVKDRNMAGGGMKRKAKARHDLRPLFGLVTSVNSALSATHAFLNHHDLLLLPSHTLPLESTISSTSISLSRLQSLLAIRPRLTPSLSPIAATIDNCWFHRYLLSASSDSDPRWTHTFRMSKPIFSLLLSTLSHSLHSSVPSIPPNYTLSAALYRLAHAAPYATVAHKFGLTSSDACRAFYVVIKVICDRLGHLFEFRSDMEGITEGFGQISLYNCCGILGLGKFPVEGELLGKKGYLMVQALVDSKGRFLDISAGWPNTMKPEHVLRQTKLFISIEQLKDFLNGPVLELKDENFLPPYILAASCYPLLPWLITPYIKNVDGDGLNEVEATFNNVHSRAMRLVEMAFRGVKANWKLLRRKWKEEFVEFLPFVITAGCLLNNFLMKNGESLRDEDEWIVEEQEIPDYNGEVIEGVAKTRDILALHLSQVSQ